MMLVVKLNHVFVKRQFGSSQDNKDFQKRSEETGFYLPAYTKCATGSKDLEIGYWSPQNSLMNVVLQKFAFGICIAKIIYG